MKKIAILTFLLLMLLSSICFAEKQEWIDKSYNFSKVQKAFIYDPNILNEIKNGIIENEILEVFKDKRTIKNVKIIDLLTIINLIKIDTGIDVIELHQVNQQEAFKVLDENIPKYADIIIYSTVSRYSMSSQYKEGFSYNTTGSQTSYVNASNGAYATIQTPTTETHTIPNRNIPVANAFVRWDIRDTKTQKIIFSRIDNRSKENGTIFNNTKPKSLYERISDSFFNDLSNMINKNN